MDLLEFNVFTGIITVFSFVLAIWVWIRSKYSHKELITVLQSINKIASRAVWENETIRNTTTERKLSQSEKTLAYIENIRQLTDSYKHSYHVVSDNVLMQKLLKDGDILGEHNILDIEMSDDITEIWMVSPDLKPDSSDRETGRVVNLQIGKGKKYVYFFPDDMKHESDLIDRLLGNIGHSTGVSNTEKINLVKIPSEEFFRRFGLKNTILFFRDSGRTQLPLCYEEIVLEKTDSRGAFWQERLEDSTMDIKHFLSEALRKSCQSKES